MELNFNLKKLSISDYVSKINNVVKEIQETQKKLSALNTYKQQLYAEEFDSEFRPYSKPVFDYVDSLLTPLIMEPAKHFNFVSQDGQIFDSYETGYYVMIIKDEKDLYYYAIGSMKHGCSGMYAKYKTLEKLKSVIADLVLTIKRGEFEFTFPKDD